MEDLKKRKLDEIENAQIYSTTSEGQLRSLLEPLAKSQLVDLLAKLGSKYSPVAGEIMNLASADPVHRKLFVRGLAWNTTSETLCAAFLEHGEIEEGAVIVDKGTGKSRGYGFITYKHMESAQRALRAPSKLIDGRMAACNLACEGLSSGSSTLDQAQRKLYIGGLSPETTSEMLLNFFGRHGEVEEGSVAYDKDTNKSRGFGFVTYRTVESAKKALDDPERILGGRNITVKYADNSKNRASQVQLAPAVVPMAMPMASGYPQPGKAPALVAPVGYGYPQVVASYPAASYPAGSYPSPLAALAPYPTEPPTTYASVTVKKEPLGMPQTTPVGIPGGRGKGKKQITRNDNAGSGQEEKLPGQKRRKSPQELLSNKAEEDEETEKVEDECKNGMISTTKEDAKDQSSIDNGRKRKRSSPITENMSPSNDKIGSGAKSSGLTDGSVKSVGFRQLGSRRKSKPRRAAEAGVECK